MMLIQIISLVLFLCLSTSALLVTVYKDARFIPTNATVKLADLSTISSQDECACQCFSNSSCYTASYIAINKTCSLFSAKVRRNWLRKMPSTANATVLTYGKESLPGK